MTKDRGGDERSLRQVKKMHAKQSIQDEIRDAFMYVMTSSNSMFFFLFLLLLVLGIALQYTTFHCIHSNGALATSVLANGRDVFLVRFINDKFMLN